MSDFGIFGFKLVSGKNQDPESGFRDPDFGIRETISDFKQFFDRLMFQDKKSRICATALHRPILAFLRLI
jgi:hypothetical protein